MIAYGKNKEEIMKKNLKAVFFALLAMVALAVFAACGSNNAEVAGTYEMSSISGNISGIPVSTSNYEYFRIILEENGRGVVQSKGAGVGGASYEAEGTYTYGDGVIKFTASNGFASVTEEYEYADGVITYIVDNELMTFTVVFERVEGEN